LRTMRSPIMAARRASAGIACCTSFDAATSAWRVIAPMVSALPSTLMPLSSGTPLKSITSAGANEEGLPKLAIVRADAKLCHLQARGDGGVSMHSSILTNTRTRRRTIGQSFSTRFDFPTGSFPGLTRWKNYEGIVPIVPLHERPKRAMANYHILWEAEWSKEVPVDPFLLRRIGKSDMWLVLAMWDLTEVERAALAARL